MQRSARDENQERKKAGYPPVELVGWTEPPHYDSASHKLYWAKDRTARRARAQRRRHDGPAGVGQTRHGERGRLRGFQRGHCYTDFVAGDKVAEYGIAALIAGGVAAKAGLFKVLLGALIALKKPEANAVQESGRRACAPPA